jgi:hypothetical protein
MTGIQHIVELYVRLEDLVALSKLKAHRETLLARCADTEHFALWREHCRRDIVTIDAGISELIGKAQVRGHVDTFRPNMVAGWAQYVEYPEIPVLMAVYFNEQHVGEALANLYRADLKDANLGSGHHGFRFVPPNGAFLQSERVELRASKGQIFRSFKKSPPITTSPASEPTGSSA